MTTNEHLLVILMEECSEIAQRVSKAIRFGLSEVQPEQIYTNAERIVYEFNDLVAIMEIIQEAGLLPEIIDKEAVELKKAKVAKYMKYSKKLGLIK